MDVFLDYFSNLFTHDPSMDDPWVAKGTLYSWITFPTCSPMDCQRYIKDILADLWLLYDCLWQSLVVLRKVYIVEKQTEVAYK